MSATYMVWMDMEMSGLEPDKNVILEISTVITDSDLKLIEQGPNLVVHHPARLLNAMDSWNKKHHKASGLTKAVLDSKTTLRAAETKTLRFIKKYCAPKMASLCGNSIHHDRRFLAKYMPKIHQYLHYRMVDVSTIKYLARCWYPKEFRMPKKEGKHRALDDILESIEELRFYRKHFFKKTNLRKSN